MFLLVGAGLFVAFSGSKGWLGPWKTGRSIGDGELMDSRWCFQLFCFYDVFRLFFVVCLIGIVHCPCGRGVMFVSCPTSGTRLGFPGKTYQPSRGIAARRHTAYLMYAAKISVKLDTSGAKDAIIKKIQDPIRCGRKVMYTSIQATFWRPFAMKSWEY